MIDVGIPIPRSRSLDLPETNSSSSYWILTSVLQPYLSCGRREKRDGCGQLLIGSFLFSPNEQPACSSRLGNTIVSTQHTGSLERIGSK
jgi:hypothetical protein